MARPSYPNRRDAANANWFHYETSASSQQAIEFECGELLRDGTVCQNTISPEHQTYDHDVTDSRGTTCRACGARHLVVVGIRGRKAGTSERVVFEHMSRAAAKCNDDK